VLSAGRMQIDIAAPASSERRLPRWPSRLPVRFQRFQIVDGQLVLGGIQSTVARDVSAQGLFLAGVDLPVGSRVHVYLMLEAGPVEAFGEVVHDRAHQPAIGPVVDGVGVRLTIVGARDRARLDAFLDERVEIKNVAARAADARRRASERLVLR